MLDKWLAWKVPLENVMNKDYRAFWTSKYTFGNTWGLKIGGLYWIYAKLLGTILTCDSMVWWPRFKYETKRIQLNQLQRFTWLAVTGATMTTPKVAMGLLLGLSPLHVIIEAKLRVTISGNPNPLTTATLKRLGTWNMNPSFSRWHKMMPRCIHHKPFKV
jgi:hypothetical protein